MKFTYEEEDFCIKAIDENGRELLIPKNESNSDYQRYLAWLENPEAENTTPIL